MKRRWARSEPAAALLIASLLGACAGSTEKNASTLACPPTQIAVPADRVGYDDNEGRLRFVAAMDQLTSECRAHENDIEVDIAFTMSAERGPAFEEGPVRLNYFLATVDPEREIVDKQVLDVELGFAPDQPVSAVREKVTIRLPASNEASGANYSLYLGFQLDG